MNVNEIMISNPIMAIHLFAGIGALFIGALQIFNIPRGTKEHKTIGRLWVALMLVLALTSLVDFMGNGFISMPAHVFTAFTFILIPLSIWGAKNHKIKLHKYCMLGAFYGVLVAAFLALLAVPGRLLNTWFFDGMTDKPVPLDGRNSGNGYEQTVFYRNHDGSTMEN